MGTVYILAMSLAAIICAVQIYFSNNKKMQRLEDSLQHLRLHLRFLNRLLQTAEANPESSDHKLLGELEQGGLKSLEKIKEYFGLDDIIFYSPASGHNGYDISTSSTQLHPPHRHRQHNQPHEAASPELQMRFISHLRDIEESVTKRLKQKQYVVMTINDRGINYRLCLIRIPTQMHDYKIAVCITSASSPPPSNEDIDALVVALQVFQMNYALYLSMRLPIISSIDISK